MSVTAAGVRYRWNLDAMGDEANVAEVLRRGTHYGRIEYDDYTSFVGRVKNGEEMIGEFVDTRKKKPVLAPAIHRLPTAACSSRAPTRQADTVDGNARGS